MKRKYKDILLKDMTYIASFIGTFILFLIVMYLVIKGAGLIKIHLLTSNYNAETENAAVIEDYVYHDMTDHDGNYSKKWGIAFEDVTTSHKEEVISVSYIDENSPFNHLYSTVAGKNNQSVSIEEGSIVKNMYYLDDSGNKTFLSETMMKDAANLTSILDEKATGIISINYQSMGGGIKGSLIVTMYLIVISLLISLPIGVSAAIYLHEYAKKSRLNSLIRQGIDTLTGVPSIIYGLMGVTVLFPITKLVGAKSTSVLLGALTMAVILLPTIISSTTEALIVVPQGLRDASLSLGATKSQTIFKVVLPSAINGILTGVLLSIGRVIGESAALVYTTSTVINDAPTILSQGTSLSLMIWSIMSSEQPNYELASAISLIILMVVFMINGVVKLVSKRFVKSFE